MLRAEPGKNGPESEGGGPVAVNAGVCGTLGLPPASPAAGWRPNHGPDPNPTMKKSYSVWPRWAGLLVILSSACAAEPKALGDPAKAGYTVIMDLLVNENGSVEATTVKASEESALNAVAAAAAKQRKLPIRTENGRPMKYHAEAPLYFAVEGDGGAAIQNEPMPVTQRPVMAQYPTTLRDTGVSGGAILRLRITAGGNVAEASVVRASHPEFGEQASKALRQWKFKPALKDGQPIEVVRYQAVSFSVGEKPTEWQWKVAPRPCLPTFEISTGFIPVH